MKINNTIDVALDEMGQIVDFIKKTNPAIIGFIVHSDVTHDVIFALGVALRQKLGQRFTHF
jgi:hypothetical protein